MGIRQEAERLNGTTLDELDKIAEILDKTAGILSNTGRYNSLEVAEICLAADKIRSITGKFTSGGGPD